MSFDHEKLDVYDAAIDLVAVAHDIVCLMPRGHGHLADQLRRAATSVPLKIAEGAEKYPPKDKARFYRIARRSATECAAKLRAGCDLLLLVAMLFKLAKKCEQSSGTGSGTHTGTGAGS